MPGTAHLLHTHLHRPSVAFVDQRLPRHAFQGYNIPLLRQRLVLLQATSIPLSGGSGVTPDVQTGVQCGTNDHR